jgi:4-hydroxy-L-threonine phosphate dehydrogenase PdxA
MIGITMGDPSGVGPEVICKALRDSSPAERMSTMLFGNAEVLQRANALVGSGLRFRTAGMESGHAPPEGSVALVDIPVPAGFGSLVDGAVSAAGGACAYAYIAAAVKAALSRDISVIVTAPINKAALHEAGYRFDGHTELLAHLTGAKSSFMLLASDVLSTLHVSTHVSLAGAVQRVTFERELATIREGATRGEFDLVIAQYHDQGHIPTKLIAFDTTVNVSLGLPILRTSVDHGTAFDIAWKGVADHVNMLAAIAYARRLAGASQLR